MDSPAPALIHKMLIEVQDLLEEGDTFRRLTVTSGDIDYAAALSSNGEIHIVIKQR